MFVGLNWLAIFLATIVYFIAGGLWFAPFLFGKLWHKAIGFEKPKGWKPSTKYYVGPLLGCFVISLTTAILISALKINTYREAIMLGFIVGIGYTASVSFINAITPTTPRPFLQGTIVGLYHTIGTILAAIIIIAMR